MVVGSPKRSQSSRRSPVERADKERRARAAQLFHALSDETRLELLDRLRGGERCVCHLTDLLDAAQSRLSFHLKTLKDVGLVTDRREGRWVHYAINREVFDEAVHALGVLHSGPHKAGKGCC